MTDPPVIERSAGEQQEGHRRGPVAAPRAGSWSSRRSSSAWRTGPGTQQARSLTDQAERSLDAVAELKAGQIATWQSERHGDAELLSGDDLLSAATADLLAGRDGAASAARIRSYLDEMREVYDYVDVVLVAPGGRVLIRVPAKATHPLGPRVRALVAEAERTGEVKSRPTCTSARTASPASRWSLRCWRSGPRDPPVACVVLHTDPRRFLYPFIQDWPFPSTTGETLLVERHGDRVEYLNELRHRKGTALRLSVSAAEAALPAAMAVRGRRGIVEGVDYRGVPVMAAIAPVVATDWYVIAKVDRTEVLEPIRRRGWLTAGFTLLVVVLAAVGTMLLWRLRERQVSAELVAGEQKYRALVDGLPAGVVVHAADTSIVLSNPAASRLLGLSADQLLGRTAVDPAWHFVNEDGSAMALEDYPVNRVTASGGAFDGVIAGVAHSAGAESVWLLCNAYPVRRGDELLQVVVTFIDITDMVRAEQELRASERKFRETVESLDEGYYSVTVDGVLLDHNPAFCRVLGISEDADLRGRNLPDFWESPTDREVYVAELLAKGHLRDFIAKARKADGTRLVALLGAHLVIDEQGGVRRIEGTVVDFTARKAAEDEVARLNAELEQRVADRTAELDGANKELEAFAYSVSHDLRAPLRHISGFSGLLAERAGEELDDKSRHYVEVISTSVRQMGVLIDDLLQFSRTGRAELVIEPVDMQAILLEALEPLQREIDGRDVEWSVGELPPVVADRALLRQVWANLVGNAVKYTRGRAPAKIEIGAAGANGEFVFFVRDNGVGFDMQYVHKLFGVFQRLHSDAEFEGTGIGLANVKRIVTRLGGAVWAEGEPGQGATFYFSLPNRKGPT